MALVIYLLQVTRHGPASWGRPRYIVEGLIIVYEYRPIDNLHARSPGVALRLAWDGRPYLLENPLCGAHMVFMEV